MNGNEKHIVPLYCKAGYLKARKLVAEKGMRLPSNVLHDDYLVRSNRWQEVKKNLSCVGIGNPGPSSGKWYFQKRD